ncbi:hypothetical protein Hanom_Chr00s087185g01797091 [Helianthus anomalus]
MIQNSYVLRLYTHSQLYIHVVLTFMSILHSYSYSYELCFHLHFCNFVTLILIHMYFIHT